MNGADELADGVTILATPGHTAGRQSILIRAGEERVVVGAQLVWRDHEIDAEVASAATSTPSPNFSAQRST